VGNVIYKFNREMLRGQKLHIGSGGMRQKYATHWHSYYEILCYHNCVGTSVLNGETYPITESCLFMLTPKDFHSLEMESLPGTKSYVISFSEQMISDSIFSEVAKGPLYIQKLPEGMIEQIEHLHRSFYRCYPHRTEHLYHLFNSMLIEILAHGSRLSQTTADINPMIRESISVMLADPGGEYSLADFSQRFNISSTYFSRMFHENAGISFKQYQTLLQVEYAKRLLEESKLPIIDVGNECGFHTPSQFIRSFKQLTGLTPSAYRTANIQEEKNK